MGLIVANIQLCTVSNEHFCFSFRAFELSESLVGPLVGLCEIDTVLDRLNPVEETLLARLFASREDWSDHHTVHSKPF